MNLAGGLGLNAVRADAAQIASLRGQRARLEEARSLEPFIDAHGIHKAIVVQTEPRNHSGYISEA
jgi:hypothetical protein